MSSAPAPSASQIIVTIGISMPNVPQEVPIEKLMRAAMTKIRNGRSASGRLESLTKPEMKIPVPISWRHTPPRLQERMRISIGGTIFPIPPTMQSMNSFGVRSFRGMYSRKAVTRPAKAPKERPAVGL